ncbi:MAG: hypothetical protein ABIO46_03095 [Chitinophagales bacterium]
MKKFVLVLLMQTAIIFNSCKKGETNSFVLGVAVQSSFNQDHIKVSIDGEDIINATLQTNYSLGICLDDGQVTTKKQ